MRCVIDETMGCDWHILEIRRIDGTSCTDYRRHKGIGFGLVKAFLRKGCHIATCYHADTVAAEATQALFHSMFKVFGA